MGGKYFMAKDEEYEATTTEEEVDPNEKDENVDELMDNDELSPEEEGFMKGYDETDG